MIRATKRLQVLASAACAVLVLIAMPAPAGAVSGQAFSISPPLIELKADPGQTVTAKIKLTNISSDELLIKTQFNDFGAKDETGAPNIIFDDTKSTSFSLRQWIASNDPFKVKSKETKELTFPITVPADAEPGGHYAVIRFSGTVPDMESSGVALTASISTLLLLQVSGEISQKASMAEFFTATQHAKSGFFESTPIMFSERVKNEGNVHLKPTGTVDVFNMFGQRVASLRANGDPNDSDNQPKSVLPDSIRKFEQRWDDGWAFGYYTANAQFSYGDGQVLTGSTSFWVVPYKIIILTLAGLAILFFVGRRGIKRYNAHIIAKATKK